MRSEPARDSSGRFEGNGDLATGSQLLKAVEEVTDELGLLVVDHQDMGLNATAATVVHRPNAKVCLGDAECLLDVPQLAVVLDHVLGRQIGVRQISLQSVPSGGLAALSV
jgi:hypothetical protein